jgi:hypothetical protein
MRWIIQDKLKSFGKILLFANTPGFIIDELAKTKIVDILYTFHNNKDEVIDQIQENYPLIESDNDAYIYTYLLLLYLYVYFEKPYNDIDIDISKFVFLSNVIELLNVETKHKITTIIIPYELPNITIL